MGSFTSRGNQQQVGRPQLEQVQKYYMRNDNGRIVPPYQLDQNEMNPRNRDFSHLGNAQGDTINYPPYVLMGAHYNQQVLGQQQYALGYPQRGALSSLPNTNYPSQVQNYYNALNQQAPQQPPSYYQTYPQGLGYPYGTYPGSWGMPPGPGGMNWNGGVPVGDGSMVMYETGDPYHEPLQEPHWHRKNRPESGYAVNIVKMNPGGTLQERPNQF